MTSECNWVFFPHIINTASERISAWRCLWAPSPLGGHQSDEGLSSFHGPRCKPPSPRASSDSFPYGFPLLLSLMFLQMKKQQSFFHFREVGSEKTKWNLIWEVLIVHGSGDVVPVEGLGPQPREQRWGAKEARRSRVPRNACQTQKETEHCRVKSVSLSSLRCWSESWRKETTCHISKHHFPTGHFLKPILLRPEIIYALHKPQDKKFMLQPFWWCSLTLDWNKRT